MVTTITEKGQIVIPVDLRRKYNIEAGDKIELMDIGGEIIIIPMLVKNPIDEAKGILKGGITTRGLLALSRKEEEKLEKKKK